MKKQKVQEMEDEKKTGKITKGPQLKRSTRYQFKQYLPNEEELGKPVSKVNFSEDLIKEKFDNFYRKGMMEVRNIKVHANRTKGIKVQERFRE